MLGTTNLTWKGNKKLVLSVIKNKLNRCHLKHTRNRKFYSFSVRSVILFYLWTEKEIFSLVTTPLVIILLSVLIRRKKIWSYTESKEQRNWENVPSDMCAQRRLRSACASVQSDQSLFCPYEKTLRTWLSKMRPVKIPIRLRESADWSEPSLGVHVRSTFSAVAGQIFSILKYSLFSPLLHIMFSSFHTFKEVLTVKRRILN